VSGVAKGDPDPGGAVRQIARRRLTRVAVGYAVATAVLVVVNVVTHGPSWWYFAAAGLGTALGMQALSLRR
jgi:hypothetical protein